MARKLKTFKLTANLDYEVEAESEEEAYNELEERFAIQNTTAENEFWDSLEVKEVDELTELVKDKVKNENERT